MRPCDGRSQGWALRGNDVELELQKLRGELGSGSTPELEAGAPGQAQPQTTNTAPPRTASSNGEQAFPSADVGESALPSAEPPRAGDGT